MTTIGNTQFVSNSKAKTQLAELVETGKPTVLLKQNEPVGALVSIDRYNDYLAMEKLIRYPTVFDELREKARRARGTPLEELRSLEEFEREKRSEAKRTRAVKTQKRAR